MEIPVIYVMITAEVLLILLGLSATLIFLLMRDKPNAAQTTPEIPLQQAEEELDTIDLDNNYIDFLEQQIERNSIKLKQAENIEEDKQTEENPDPETETGTEADSTEPPSPPPSELQSELLQAREAFLLIEKQAADKTEHEIHFWDSLYDGIKTLLEKYKSSETLTRTLDETTEPSAEKVQSEEKVFYIETQGRKIEGEVNKLKDIIYEQENALSSMKKAMINAQGEEQDESEAFQILRENMEAIERQLNDSKMCMEVLEMENDRLQEEVNNIDARHNALFQEQEETPESDSLIDLDQMKEVVEQQELKINQLIESIESLEIDAAQAERLKQTINDFSRTSKEMMSCIIILEEENERLQASTTSEPVANTENEENTDTTDNEDPDATKAQIAGLEEELIKKDVAYAKLQGEFSSMETEYLAMYEAMHGDNG
ncbi:hypothetical protein MNBD_GAMMA08-369 [hydrothermal vent metagenome]|uniref:Uncharacterized protein n=2 Tax=hydrothermal vent metagenome TaxID=652676 RepID=A0A3B0XCB2_9ZZZZ